jgi:hypothetical protein
MSRDRGGEGQVSEARGIIVATIILLLPWYLWYEFVWKRTPTKNGVYTGLGLLLASLLVWAMIDSDLTMPLLALGAWIPGVAVTSAAAIRWVAETRNPV